MLRQMLNATARDKLRPASSTLDSTHNSGRRITKAELKE
mgnify:CR=1 FL=1